MELKEKRYVVVDNAMVNLHTLECHVESYIKGRMVINKPRECMRKKVESLTYKLGINDIPYDKIVAVGEPGIIISSDFRQSEIMEALKSIKHAQDMGAYKNQESKVKLFRSYNGTRVTNLTINDTLFNYIPFNVSFEPRVDIDGESVNPCELLDIKDQFIVNTNSCVINLEELLDANSINEQVPLLFNGNIVHSYEEYFELFLRRKYRFSDTISMTFPKQNIK